jgi:predicted SAM-dependent methyltransferase
MDTIESYLDERFAQARRGRERGRAAQLARRVTTWEMRQAALLHGTALLSPYARRRAARLVAGGNGAAPNVHLGCGLHRLPGWVNIDILGTRADLHWDLRKGVPFPPDSVGAIFLEHVLEHFSLRDGIGLLRACHRALEPGGTLRVGVPDFGRYIKSYAGDGAFIESQRPGRPTPLLAVAELALQHGHRSVWDVETLARLVRECGFGDARPRTFGDSDISPAPDNPIREEESIYVEGHKTSGAERTAPERSVVSAESR